MVEELILVFISDLSPFAHSNFLDFVFGNIDVRRRNLASLLLFALIFTLLFIIGEINADQIFLSPSKITEFYLSI